MESWTPYGLEHLRVRHIRRRRLVAVALVLLLALGWALLLDGSKSTETELLAGGGRNTITLDVQERPRQSGPDATVQVSPGRIIRADAGEPEAAADTQRPTTPTTEAIPINWLALLVRFGPFVLLGLVLWAGFRRTGKTDEVNYGIYKGAMPIEMITASHAHLVVTSRAAPGSLFGRTREDFVSEEAR